VVVEGPITQTKWSHIPQTFTEACIKLVSFPHTYAMIIAARMDKWDVTGVLINNGSQAEILFLSAFDKMGFDRKQLKETMKQVSFVGKRIEPVDSKTLPVSFRSLQNARTEFVTFDVVNMHYPYNAIFGRGLLNTFEAALHLAYVFLKVPALLRVISIHGSQKDARNIEQGFAPRHRNANCLQEGEGGDQQDMSTPKTKANISRELAIEPKCETKRVSLDPRVSEKTIMISQDLIAEEETKLLSFLDKNKDGFTWKTSDMGVRRSIMEQKLHVKPSAKPRKQKLYKMSDEKIAAAKAEV
jgi:hypothetical protein